MPVGQLICEVCGQPGRYVDNGPPKHLQRPKTPHVFKPLRNPRAMWSGGPPR